MARFLLIFIFILSLIGAVDAGYLLVQTVSGKAVICPSIPVGRFNLNQCSVVLATSYAKFLGLPTAFYGLVAYLFFAILALYALTEKWRNAVKLVLYLAGLGFLISLYFVYLQIFIIKALCFYCLISAANMILIFIVSVAYNLRYSIRQPADSGD